MDYRVINKDSDIMYYHIGAHPGFMCPVNNGENIENCILRFEKEENFISYEYDIKNLEFNFYPRKQKATHFLSQFPCLIRMLFSLNTRIHTMFLS